MIGGALVLSVISLFKGWVDCEDDYSLYNLLFRQWDDCEDMHSLTVSIFRRWADCKDVYSCYSFIQAVG